MYVHCDWHASHYIKTEMDKIFGYENFQNEIIWQKIRTTKAQSMAFGKVHDVIFYYKKGSKQFFETQYKELDESYVKSHYRSNSLSGRLYRTVSLLQNGSGPARVFGDKKLEPPPGRHWIWSQERIDKAMKDGLIRFTSNGRPEKIQFLDDIKGDIVDDMWNDIYPINSQALESIGYPTQKPEALLERIIKTSSSKGDIIADFFVGGGTTCAVAQKLNRKFIGCDSSRVAISVTLDRLIKVGEEMSGIMSNITAKGKSFQLGFQTEGVSEKVPNIEVYYLGVYPVEKFKNLDQEEFIHFVLTAYGASRNTGAGVAHGFRPPAQQEPILVGPSDPNKSIEADEIKEFFNEVKSKVEPNKMIRAKIIAWRFSRQVMEYIKVLQRYAEKHSLPIELEAIPLDSKEFRKRILQRMPDVDEAELFLRFSKAPVIGDIKVKKVGTLEYEFEAVDTISTNEDGWLVNCQWDFDYQEGHFSANKDYILSREKKKDKKHGEIFEAIFKARHKFEKEGEYVVACKVQDNLAGESILNKRIKIE
ncbi:MAG: site-specific DNA-methyltransferase [Candidatus Levybacteria bacterium]|nr:site-specific DNA-methyltransferase [Candidatus Levybacteria bacterium]